MAAGRRARGARLVAAVTHQAMPQDRALAAAGDVELILGGHEHEPLIAEEGRALITKAGSDGRYLVRVDLRLAPDGPLLGPAAEVRQVSAPVAPHPPAQ